MLKISSMVSVVFMLISSITHSVKRPSKVEKNVTHKFQIKPHFLLFICQEYFGLPEKTE